MSPDDLRAEVAVRLDRGENLTDVQAELIEPAIWLSEEDRDALWLYAWSYRAGCTRHGQRELQAV